MASTKHHTSLGGIGDTIHDPSFDWEAYRRQRRRRKAAAAKREARAVDTSAPPVSSRVTRRVSPARPTRPRSPGESRSRPHTPHTPDHTHHKSSGGYSMDAEVMVSAPQGEEVSMGAQQSLAMRRKHQRLREEEESRKRHDAEQREALALARQREQERIREIARNAGRNSGGGGGASGFRVHGGTAENASQDAGSFEPAGQGTNTPMYGGPQPSNGGLQHPPQPAAPRQVNQRLPPLPQQQQQQQQQLQLQQQLQQQLLLQQQQQQQQLQQQQTQAQAKGGIILSPNALPQQHVSLYADQPRPSSAFGATIGGPQSVQLNVGAGGGVYTLPSPDPRMRAGNVQQQQGNKTPSAQLFEFLGTPYDADDPVDLPKLFQTVFGFCRAHQQGLDLDERHGDFLMTLLHRVSALGYTDLVELLALMGADINSVNKKGITPLMEAASCGYHETCRVLLKYGANLDHQSEVGHTAMRMAVKNHHEDAARLLLGAGADLSLGSEDEMKHSGVPLLDLLVQQMPELALEALDRRRKPLYRAKGVVGQTMTHKEWEDQVEQAAKKRLAKASRRHRRRPSLVVPANLRAYLEAQRRTQGIMTEYDYTGTENGENDAATTLRSMVELERLDLLVHPWTTHLLDHKWSKFAKGIFFRGFMFYMVYLSAFCISTYLYVNGNTQYDTATMETADQVRLVFDVITLVCTAVVSVQELWEIYEVGSREYFQNGWNIFDVTQAVLVWLVVWLRVGKQSEAELAVMAVVAPCMWFKLLNYARTLSFIGPTVHMVSMMVVDILRFLAIFLVVLAGFSHGLFVLSLEGYDAINDTLMHTFTMNLGDFDLGAFEGLSITSHKVVSLVIFVVYNVMSVIILLNLVIAIMSDTYAKYSESMTGAWRMQQAMFILAEQSRMNNATYRRKYAITRLWVLDADRPIDGLAHFNANPNAWRALSDTNNDAPAHLKEPRRLPVPDDNGVIQEVTFPRVVENSVVDLATAPVEVRQALLDDMLQRKGVI